MGLLGVPFGLLFELWGDLRAPEVPQNTPEGSQGPIRELFWLDLAWFSIVFQTISACTLAVAKVCVIRSALFPAQLPTGLVAVWASPTGYIVNLAERKLPQTTLSYSELPKVRWRQLAATYWKVPLLRSYGPFSHLWVCSV